MQSSLYVGLSGQLALQRRMDTIASNIANQSTAGFRSEDVTFASVMSTAGVEPVTYATRGQTHISRRMGDVVRTGNPLDVALQGQGWLSIDTGAGPAYTRDGRLQMSAAGALQTVTGRAVLDAGGAPIQANPNGGPLSITRTGAVVQDGQTVGSIGLFLIPPNATLSRLEGASVRPDTPAVAASEGDDVGLLSGYIERSNVDPIKEMTRLIQVHRTFDAVTSALNQTESTVVEAIRGLAGS
jgi:flagellar basal-body rod protein FlgF